MNSSNELEPTQTADNNLAAMDQEEITLNYLQQHHDFFSQHQDLLMSLHIPHLSNGAVSLIERQVSLLREKNIQLKKNLDQLISVAKENENSNLRMHKLTLALLDCEGVEAIAAELNEILCDEFLVDATALKLFAEPESELQAHLFTAVDSVLGRELDKLLYQRKPVCGFFKKLPLPPLFEKKAENITSLAVIPLFVEKNSCMGALVLGSQNVNRFSASMGTHFLEKLGEVLSHVCVRHLP